MKMKSHSVVLLILRNKMLIFVHLKILALNSYKHHGQDNLFTKIIMEMLNILTKYSLVMTLFQKFNAQLFVLVEILMEIL